MLYSAINWIIIKIEFDDEVIYKLVCSIGAGLNDWRINSGITKIQDLGDQYRVYGNSGAMYVLNKDSEEVDRPIHSIMSRIDEAPAKITQITIKEMPSEFFQETV